MTCICGCGEPIRGSVGLTEFDAADDAEVTIVWYAKGPDCLARCGLYCHDHAQTNIVGRDRHLQGVRDGDPKGVGLIGCCHLCAIDAARFMEKVRKQELVAHIGRIKAELICLEAARRVCGFEYDRLSPEVLALTGLLVRATLAGANPETYLADLERAHNRTKRQKGG